MSVIFPRLLAGLAILWVVRSVMWGPVAWTSPTSWVVATTTIGVGALVLLWRRGARVGAGLLLAGCLAEVWTRPTVDDEPALLLGWLAAIVLLTEDAPHERAFLLRVNTTTVYAFAAASKLNPSWLAGEGVLGMGVVEDVLGVGLARPFPWGAIVVETALAVGLWSRRGRAPIAVLGVAFHTTIVVAASTALADVLFLIVLNFALVASYGAYWVRSTTERSDVRVAGPGVGGARVAP